MNDSAIAALAERPGQRRGAKLDSRPRQAAQNVQGHGGLARLHACRRGDAASGCRPPGDAHLAQAVQDRQQRHIRHGHLNALALAAARRFGWSGAGWGWGRGGGGREAGGGAAAPAQLGEGAHVCGLSTRAPPFLQWRANPSCGTAALHGCRHSADSGQAGWGAVAELSTAESAEESLLCSSGSRALSLGALCRSPPEDGAPRVKVVDPLLLVRVG